MFMFWDKICSNETNIKKYHKVCHEQGTNLTACHKCDKRFTNFALRRHNGVCHTKHEFNCSECGLVLITDNPVQRDMCYHWKRGLVYMSGSWWMFLLWIFLKNGLVDDRISLCAVRGCPSFKTRATSVNAAPGGQSRPFLGDYWDFYFYMVCSEPVASASSSLREKEHTYH